LDTNFNLKNSRTLPKRVVLCKLSLISLSSSKRWTSGITAKGFPNSLAIANFASSVVLKYAVSILLSSNGING